MADKREPSYQELKRRLAAAEKALEALGQGGVAQANSGENFRALVENINDVIYTVDVNGTVIYLSPSIQTCLGYEPADLIGSHFSHLVHPEDLAAIRQAFVDALDGRLYVSEYRLRSKTGEYRWVRTSSRSFTEDGRVLGLRGVLTDITDHKRAERALRENQRILDETGRMGRIGGWEHDLATGKAVWTKALYDLIEIPHDQEPPGTDEHLSYYPPRDREALIRAYSQAVEEGVSFDLELQGHTARRKLKWWRVQGRPVMEHGKCVRMRGILQDITERKQAELALLESENRHRSTLENILEGCQIIDPEWRYLYVNDAAVRHSRRPKEDLLGRRIMDAYPGIEQSEVFGCMRRCMEGREPKRMENLFIHPDGSKAWYDLSILPVPEGILILSIDITERKEAEQALRQSEQRLIEAQRMAKIGDFTWDIKTGEVSWSDAMFDLLQYPKGEKIDYAKVNREIHHPDDLERITRWWNECITSGQTEITPNEYRLIRRDGQIIHARIMGIVEHHQGQPGKVFATAQDITEQKMAEQALRESEAQLRSIFHTSPDAMLVFNKQGVIVKTNPAAEKIYGYGAGEMVGLSARDIVHPDYYHLFEVFKKVGLEIQGFHDETKDLRKGGSVFDVEVSGSPFEYQRETHLLVIARDITERKKAEVALRESERILNDTGIKGRIGGWEHDLATGKAVWTKALFEILEFPPGEPPPGVEEYPPYYPPGDRETILAAYSRAVNEGVPFDLELQVYTFNQGKLIWSRTQGEPVFEDGKCVKMRGIFQDITKRKLVESEQGKLRGQLSTAMEIARLGHWEYDVATDLFTFNDHFYKLLRTTAEQVGGYTMSSAEYARRFIHPEDMAVVGEETKRALDATDPGFRRQIEHRIIYADGTEGHISVQIFIVKDRQGRTVRTYGVNQDITERKQAEAQIIRERNRAQHYLDVAGVIFIALDRSGQVSMINRKGLEILGCQESEIIGKNWFDTCIPRRDQGVVKEVFQQIMNGDIKPVEYFENQIVTRFGQERTIAWHNSLLKNTQGAITGSLSSGEDITERKRAEEEKDRLESQLRQAQKMEAVGTLAGGIAHDFNNILAIITGYAELALTDVREGRSSPEEIRGILQAAIRAKELVRQILAFSRKMAIEPKPMDLNEIVASIAPILKRTLPKMIAVGFRLESNPLVVEGDPNQMEQVLLNLASNAQDAMPHGGRLVMQTGQVSIKDDDEAADLGAPPGDYVVLSVSDTGVGMDQEALEHIFEPFYTTKEVGKGTGLGLATAYGIVKGHNGHITCQSEPGVGTTFKVYLPLIKAVAKPVEPQKADAPAVQEGSETILVVDDEEALRNLALRSLEKRGYQVMTAASGEEALDLYRNPKRRPDLVVMDLGMPGMGGQKALEEILALDPAARVIIASGYSASNQVEIALQSGATGYVAKPFRQAELLETIRRVLDQSRDQ